MSLEAFITERKERILELNQELENFNYDVVVKHGYNVKSRSKEENEKIAKREIAKTIKNLEEYIETPNVFERMKKNEKR